jgi:RIO-like serine/threonine protein kinase
MKCVTDARFESRLLGRITTEPDRAMQSLGQTLKHDGTTSVVRIEENGQCWVIKRYNTKNPWHALRRTVRRSRAANCWHMSALLTAAGVRVPAPVAYMEKRVGPLRGRSYFVYEYVDAEDLLSYMMTHTNTCDIDHVIQKVTDTFTALHAAKINHGDMKATNLMVDGDQEIALIDLDAAVKPDSAETFRRGYDKDRSRFMRNWRDNPELTERFDRTLPE